MEEHEGDEAPVREEVREEVGALADGRTIRFFSWAPVEPGEDG